MLKEVFQGLQNRVMQPGGVQPQMFKHFDWYNDQYDLNPATQKLQVPFLTPAVFVEFLPYTPQSLSRRVQLIPLNFRLHLVSDIYSHSRAGMAEQAAALSHIDLANALHHLIHGHHYLIPANAALGLPARAVYNTCARVRQEPDHAYSNLVVCLMEYRTIAFDYSATRSTQKMNNPLLVIKKPG